MRTYKNKQMQETYEMMMVRFKSEGRPTIGSHLSQSFRDGFDGNRMRSTRGSLGHAAYAAGKDSAKEMLIQAGKIANALTFAETGI